MDTSLQINVNIFQGMKWLKGGLIKPSAYKNHQEVTSSCMAAQQL